MQFHVVKAGSARARTACAIVGIPENAAMSDAARRVDRAAGGARLITGDLGALPPVAGIGHGGDAATPATSDVVLPSARRQDHAN